MGLSITVLPPTLWTLAGGVVRSWGQGAAVAGGGQTDRRNSVLTLPLSGAVSKHPWEQTIVKCGFPLYATCIYFKTKQLK